LSKWLGPRCIRNTFLSPKSLQIFAKSRVSLHISLMLFKSHIIQDRLWLRRSIVFQILFFDYNWLVDRDFRCVELLSVFLKNWPFLAADIAMFIRFAIELSLGLFVFLWIRLVIKWLVCGLLKNSFSLFWWWRLRRKIFVSLISLKCFSVKLTLVVLEIWLVFHFVSDLGSFSLFRILRSLIKLIYINFRSSSFLSVKCISIFCKLILVKRFAKFHMWLFFFSLRLPWNSVLFRGAAWTYSVQGMSSCSSIFNSPWNLVIGIQRICWSLCCRSFLKCAYLSSLNIPCLIDISKVLSFPIKESTFSFCTRHRPLNVLCFQVLWNWPNMSHRSLFWLISVNLSNSHNLLSIISN